MLTILSAVVLVSLKVEGHVRRRRKVVMFLSDRLVTEWYA